MFAIRIRSEDDHSLVLFTATYHKDQEVGIQNGKKRPLKLSTYFVDTVLTWTTFDGDEAALSFETTEGCNEFWRLVCRFQGRSSDEKAPQIGNFAEDADEQEFEIEDSLASQGASSLSSSRSFDYLNDEPASAPTVEISFPERPEIGNLPEVEEAFYQALLVPMLRRRVAGILLQYRYVSALLELFRRCEEFGDEANLQVLFRILKCVFLLNNQEILKELMSEDNYLEVAGVFEYDPSFSDSKPEFRAYLSDKQRFKQVVPINDQEVLNLIHQTFRLQFFKDVILARILDEESSASFLLTIRLNHMAIVNALDNDPQVLEVIRTLLQSKSMLPTDRLQLLAFFKEFLSLAKTVTLRKGLQIYQPAVLNDFLHFLTHVLQESTEEQKEKLLAIELLVNFLQHDAGAVRSFLLADSGLLLTLIDLFVEEGTPSALRWQIVTCLRLLLDTFASTTPAASGLGAAIGSTLTSAPSPVLLNQAITAKSTEDFLNVFYPEHACRLLKPLIDFDKSVFELQSDASFFLRSSLSPAKAEILFHLGELLCSFIGQHKYRIKYLILRNQLIQNSLLMLRAREKHLQLTGLRVFRTTLAAGDEFYHRFFIQHRSFAPLLALYAAVGGEACDNMVTSAILDAFEYVRVAKPVLQDIVRHLAAYHATELGKLRPEPVFRGLLELAERIERGLSAVSFYDEDEDEEQDSQDSNNVLQFKDKERDDEDYFGSVDDTATEEDEEDGNQDGGDEEFPPAHFFQVKSPNQNDDDDEEEDGLSALLSRDATSPTKKTKL